MSLLLRTMCQVRRRSGISCASALSVHLPGPVPSRHVRQRGRASTVALAGQGVGSGCHGLPVQRRCRADGRGRAAFARRRLPAISQGAPDQDVFVPAIEPCREREGAARPPQAIEAQIEEDRARAPAGDALPWRARTAPTRCRHAHGGSFELVRHVKRRSRLHRFREQASRSRSSSSRGGLGRQNGPACSDGSRPADHPPRRNAMSALPPALASPYAAAQQQPSPLE